MRSVVRTCRPDGRVVCSICFGGIAVHHCQRSQGVYGQSTFIIGRSVKDDGLAFDLVKMGEAERRKGRDRHGSYDTKQLLMRYMCD